MTMNTDDDANALPTADHRRRRLVKGLFAGGVALGAPALLMRPAHAAEFTIKLANNVPVTHPINVRTREAVARIKKATGDRVEFRLFPNNQLGGDADMLSQVRSGALDMYTIGAAYANGVAPNVSIHGAAFAFKDYKAVWDAMDGPLGTFERNELRKVGVHALSRTWDSGFRQTTTKSKPIRTPDDFAGLKIRTPTVPLITNIFNGLGAAPTPINTKEIYAALQTGLCDAQENPLALIDAFKFYEVQKYCSMTNHVWDGYYTSANVAFWEKLPDDLRQVIEESFNEAGMLERADLVKLNESIVGTLQGKGIVFNAVDIAPFREKLRKSGYYANFRKSVSEEGFALLEKAVGTMA